MTPDRLDRRIVASRAAWVREMLAGLRSLPLGDEAAFEADPHNGAAAESYLRRALEALLDLGRHLLAKGYGRAAGEYKEIARILVEVGALAPAEGQLLREMAGYRNRLVHFYDEIGRSELRRIGAERLGDIEGLLDRLLAQARDLPSSS